jgi:glycosyltransferase involved in cell wall biosynthesis
MTFNQAPYIKDTLDGFCMQQTTFPYVCVIMDDASTDGEQDVIAKYLQDNFLLNNITVRTDETDDYVMTFAQHRNNINCYFAVFYLKYNHYKSKNYEKVQYYKEWRDSAKYLAMCEGDDFWSLPTKLQIQYDYLESHPDVVLSCHRYSILNNTTKQVAIGENPYFDSKKHSKETEFEFDLNYYLHYWITKTLSNMYRRSAVKDDYYVGYKYARDVHFNYYVLTKGRGVCHAFNGGVYRKNVSTSVYGSLNKTEQLEINCKVYEEIAEVTGNAIVREFSNTLIVLNCMKRLESVEGGYFCALKFVSFIHRLVNFVRRGWKREIPPILP